MSQIVLNVDRNKLPEHTDEEFEAWIKYEVGQLGGLSLDNPMSDIDLEATVQDIS